MEIYRMGDMEDAAKGEAAEFKITALKQGVRNPNRVNVFVDGKFSFSLDVTQVVDFGVKIGRILAPEELVEMKKASEFGKLYQRALEWVLMRPRSVRETRDYLERKLRASSSEALAPARRYGWRGAHSLPVGRESSSEDALKLSSRQPKVFKYSKEEIAELSETVVERLKEKRYLDDRRFAEFWVENRFVKKGVSQKRLRMELTKKGVAKEIIDEVLDGRNDEEEIRKIVAKKQKKYVEPEKLIAYLCRQGFSYELARKVVQNEDY